MGLGRFFTKRIISDLSGKRDYLRRWSLWLPFGISLKLHEIVLPDDDRCEHDHPWWFIRIILWGGYTEQVKGQVYHRKPWRPWFFWRVYPCWPEFQHRILSLPRGKNWSLVLCGPKHNSWGFYTKQGWMVWHEFLKLALTSRVLWCEDGRDVGTQEDNDAL